MLNEANTRKSPELSDVSMDLIAVSGEVEM